MTFIQIMAHKQFKDKHSRFMQLWRAGFEKRFEETAFYYAKDWPKVPTWYQKAGAKREYFYLDNYKPVGDETN